MSTDSPRQKRTPENPITFNGVVRRWEAEATVKLHDNLAEALQKKEYGQRDEDEIKMVLIWQVQRYINQIINKPLLNAEGEAANLADTLARIIGQLRHEPPIQIKIDPSILADITGLYGLNGIEEMQKIINEEVRRIVDKFQAERDLSKLTPGERYLKRRGKGGYFYPYGAAGELVRAFEQRLATYFGSQGLVTNRLYDLLKIAGVVPQPNEPWERSRARAVRVELQNAVCHKTMMNIVWAIRDRLIMECRFQTEEELGRDFFGRGDLEQWLIESWFAWMTDAAKEALRIGEFALEAQQLELWKERIAVLFQQERGGGGFTVFDILADMLQACQEYVTDELLDKIPMREGVLDKEADVDE